jgi:hypothetical protein
VITINTDKGLVNVSTWEDILERPAFRVGINPDEHELKSILGRYVFGAKVQCGLSNCRTPHTKGYLVATKNGVETNIGKDCGSKYFGVDFDHQAKQFEIDLAAKENREMLWSFYFRTEELEEKISTLRESKKGAVWVSRNCDALQNPSKVPLVVVRKLGEMVRQGTSLLTKPRKATSEEFKNMLAVSGQNLQRPQYIDETIAEIRGIEALYKENNLRELLVNEIEEKLKSFKDQNIDSLSFEKLKQWKKWMLSVDLNLEKAELSIDKGRRLLTETNLKPFFSILSMEDPSEKSLFETFITKL